MNLDEAIRQVELLTNQLQKLEGLMTLLRGELEEVRVQLERLAKQGEK